MLVMVAVRDVKTGAFAAPIGVPHAALALRSFEQEVRSAESPVGKYPADFELWKVGEFDVESGAFANGQARLATGTDFVKE